MALARYRPSGSFGISTFALALLGAAAAALAAWIYTALLRWIPFIQLNFITAGGFAFGLGALAWLSANKGHARSRVLAAGLGLFIAGSGLAASYYWAWTHDLAEIGEDHPELTAAQLREDIPFERWANSRIEHGWKMDKGKEPVSGWAAMALWGAEALVMLGAGLYGGFHAAAAPYCERCRAWAVERTLLLHGHTADAVKPALAAEDLNAVLALPEIPPEARPAAAATVKDPLMGLKLAGAVCPTCREQGWLSVLELRMFLEKGKLQTKEKKLLAHAALEPSQTAKLLERVAPLAPAAVA